MDKTYDPHQVEKRWYGRWERGGLLRPPRRRRSLLHHDSAPERDRHPAHGTRVPGHDHGRADPLPPHERTHDAVAARHRSRGDRDPDGGRAPDQRGGADPAGSGPERVRGSHLALEGALGEHHHQPDAADGGVGRLGPRTFHDGRRALGRGAGNLRPALRGRPHLPRQAPGQTGTPSCRPRCRTWRSSRRRRAGRCGTSAIR